MELFLFGLVQASGTIMIRPKVIVTISNKYVKPRRPHARTRSVQNFGFCSMQALQYVENNMLEAANGVLDG